MQVTYQWLLENLSKISRYQNCNSEQNKIFVHRVLTEMFYANKHDSLTTLTMCTHKGCITLPEDIDHVVKAKIMGKTQEVFSHWYEYSYCSDCNFKDGNHCGITHLPDRYFTKYDPPFKLWYPCVKARGRENSDAYIKVHGKDVNGEKVWVRWAYGEKLPLMGDTDKPIKAGSVPIHKVIGIEKTKTNDYIDLYAECADTGELVFLSSYSPRETTPSYSRIRLLGCPTDGKVKVDLLCKLNILLEYHCSELLPIEGVNPLYLLARSVRASDDGDVNKAAAFDQLAEKSIRRENDYKFTGTDILEIVPLGSGCDKEGGIW